EGGKDSRASERRKVDQPSRRSFGRAASPQLSRSREEMRRARQPLARGPSDLHGHHSALREPPELRASHGKVGAPHFPSPATGKLPSGLPLPQSFPCPSAGPFGRRSRARRLGQKRADDGRETAPLTLASRAPGDAYR